MKKICTHCKNTFICQRENITDCQCYDVPISQPTILFLKNKTQHDCLCNDCLQKFEKMTQYAKKHQLPKKPNDMIEGTHYYMENGFFVFTELYHYLKGKCCKNGCRHCVYGFH